LDKISQLKRRLEAGLYVDNIQAISNTCMEIARGAESPLPFYVIATVFHEIWLEFSEGPVYKHEIEEIEKKLSKETQAVLDTLVSGVDTLDVLETLNALLQPIYLYIWLRHRLSS
jgi:hypothetical protein